MAVLAPMPRASADMAAMVKAGFLRNMRSACLMSFQRSPTVRSYGSGGGGDKGLVGSSVVVFR